MAPALNNPPFMKLSSDVKMLLSQISINPQRFSPELPAIKTALEMGLAAWMPKNPEMLCITPEGKAAQAEDPRTNHDRGLNIDTS